jgi:integrase/recombinase XerD
VLVMMNAIEGALAPWEPDLVEELERLGYARRTAVTLMKLAGRLSRWLEERGLSAYDLSIEVVEQFLDGLRAEGTWFHPTAKTLDWLLGYLREVGVVTPPVLLVPTSWEEKLIEQYRCYLITERGLASETAKGCVRTANLFLADHHGRQIGELTPADVSRFMTRRCRHLSATSRLATGLRSFLAFLRLEGLVVAPLADAVLSAANWSGAALPRGLTADQVTRLLATCDNQRLRHLGDADSPWPASRRGGRPSSRRHRMAGGAGRRARQRGHRRVFAAASRCGGGHSRLSAP